MPSEFETLLNWKPRLNLTRAVRINPQFTCSDWSLYSEGGDSAARQLNAALMACVNGGHDLQATRAEVERHMNALADAGATDSEPRDFLSVVLAEIFG